MENLYSDQLLTTTKIDSLKKKKKQFVEQTQYIFKNEKTHAHKQKLQINKSMQKFLFELKSNNKLCSQKLDTLYTTQQLNETKNKSNAKQIELAFFLIILCKFNAQANCRLRCACTNMRFTLLTIFKESSKCNFFSNIFTFKNSFYKSRIHLDFSYSITLL